MKRKDFIKNFGLGALSLGAVSFKDILQKQPIKIYDNYLRGTFAYNIENVFSQLKIGQILILQREADNKYDKYAIAVYYNKQKLGYIAAYENIVLANMLDAKVNLIASISYLNKKRENREIAIQIFCDLISPSSLIITEMQKRADDEDDIYRSRLFF